MRDCQVADCVSDRRRQMASTLVKPRVPRQRPRSAHEEPGVRAEKAALAIGGTEILGPACRVFRADNRRRFEPPDGCEEAIELVGNRQIAEDQGLRGGNDVAEAGL